MLSNQDVLVVDDHALQEVLRARHILSQEPLLIFLLSFLLVLAVEALAAEHRGGNFRGITGSIRHYYCYWPMRE